MAGAVEPGAPGGFFNMTPILTKFVPLIIEKVYITQIQRQ